MLRFRAIASALALSTLVIGLTAAPAAAADDINVTLAADGSTTEVTTTDPAQTVYAHFTVARGQHLILFCDTKDDAGLPGAKVLDSANKRVIVSGGIGCFRHIMPDPAIEDQSIRADGPLTLVLPPYKGKTFSVKLSYRAFDDVHTQATLDGGPVTFTPAIKGQDAFVTFDGKAGDRVYAECTSPVAGRGVTGYLLDARGNAVPSAASPQTYGWCQKGELFYYTPTLPADGTYTVQLDNFWGTDLGATLSLHKTLPTVTVAAPTDGTPVTLTTTGVGQNASAIFSLGAGEHALITCAQRSDSPAWTETILWAPPTQYVPGETRVCRHNPSPEGLVIMDSEWKWAEGPHTLEIDPKDADTGSFDLQVYKVRDKVGTVWGWDRPATVTTAQPGQNAKFNFWGEAGQKVSGTCQLASGTARTTVYDPAGEVVATGSCATGLMPVTTLAETGSYSAVVDWPGLGTNTATVSMHVAS